MKLYYPVLILILCCLFGQTYAQKEICKNIYVWDFTDENGKKTTHTKLLMQEVENALTETSCRVLQRRNYAKLAEQIDNENAIQSIEGMSSTINSDLQSIKAETVLFGKVQMDFSGNIMLAVSFQNLLTKEILKSESLMLAGEDAHNQDKRKQKIADFISHCVGPKVISNEETTYWRNVQALGTPEAYQGYLTKYPGGKYKSQAEQILADEQVWQEIQKEKRASKKITRLIKYTENQAATHYQKARDQLEQLLWRQARYVQYKRYFPEGKYADQADDLREESFYGKAMDNPVLFADDYLKTFPSGKYVSQVTNKFEDYLYSEVVSSPTFSAAEYLSKFPNGRYVAKVEEIVWGAVLSAFIKHGKASRYLELFPNGKHIKEAKAFLERD